MFKYIIYRQSTLNLHYEALFIYVNIQYTQVVNEKVYYQQHFLLLFLTEQQHS